MKETIQILGNAEAKKSHFPSRAIQEAMLQHMVRLRQVDTLLSNAYSRGALPMHFPVAGQEGFLSGISFGLSKGDWWFPTTRTPGRCGVATDHEGAGLHVVRDASPGASRLVHANGVAWAIHLKGGKEVAAVDFGESIANQDNFHVALNFAGVHSTPTLFCCGAPHGFPETAGGSVADRAVAYGIMGIRVDGSDPLAVLKGVRESVKKARAGKGATVLEADWPEGGTCPIERLASHLDIDPSTLEFTEAESDEALKRAMRVRDSKWAEGALS